MSMPGCDFHWHEERIAELEQQVECYEGMKEGVGIRIAELERKLAIAEKRLRVALDACQSLEDYKGGSVEFLDAVARARNAIKVAKE